MGTISPTNFDAPTKVGAWFREAKSRILDCAMIGDSTLKGMQFGAEYACGNGAGCLGLFGMYAIGFLHQGSNIEGNYPFGYGTEIQSSGVVRLNTVSPLVNGAKTAGDSTVSLDAGTLTGSLTTGDKLTITHSDATTGVYTVNGTFTAASNQLNNVAITPNLTKNVNDNATVSVTYDGDRTAHNATLKTFWDPASKSETIGIPSPLTVQKSMGDTSQLAVGFSRTPTVSTKTLLLDGSFTNASTITLKGAVDGETLNAEDKLYVTGPFGNAIHRVTNTTTASGGKFTNVTISPGLTGVFADNTPFAVGSLSLGYDDDWLWTVTYGKAGSGSGSGRPQARSAMSPYTAFAFTANTGTSINYGASPTGWATFTREIPAATVQSKAAEGIQLFYGYAAVGGLGVSADGFGECGIGSNPVTIAGSKLERKNATKGLSFNALVDKAGKNSMHFYNALSALTSKEWAFWLNAVLGPQVRRGLTPKLMFIVESGPNDYSSSGAVLSTDGVNLLNTKAGYKSTIRSIVQLILDAVDNAVGDGSVLDPANVRIVLRGTHVVADDTGEATHGARELWYRDVRAANAEVAAEPAYRDTVVAFDFGKAMTKAEAVAGGWYVNSSTDRIHLSYVGQREVEALFWGSIYQASNNTAPTLSSSSTPLIPRGGLRQRTLTMPIVFGIGN